MKAAGFGFPFVFVDADAVTEYIDTFRSGVEPHGPHRPEVRAGSHCGGCVEGNELRIRLQRPDAVAASRPDGNEITQTLTETLGYIENASETLEIDPSEYIATQLRGLDTELFVRDALAALGAPTQPFIKRFTRQGFEPLSL